MSVSLPGVNAALANAIRQVNAAFYRLPESRRPDSVESRGLDAELDAACVSGNRERAMAAIRAWRDHWLYEFERPARLESAGPETAPHGAGSPHGGRHG